MRGMRLRELVPLLMRHEEVTIRCERAVEATLAPGIPNAENTPVSPRLYIFRQCHFFSASFVPHAAAVTTVPGVTACGVILLMCDMARVSDRAY